MRTRREIEDELDRLRPALNAGSSPAADVSWHALHWGCSARSPPARMKRSSLRTSVNDAVDEDKKHWGEGDGPWLQEPDSADWVDPMMTLGWKG